MTTKDIQNTVTLFALRNILAKGERNEDDIPRTAFIHAFSPIDVSIQSLTITVSLHTEDKTNENRYILSNISQLLIIELHR